MFFIDCMDNIKFVKIYNSVINNKQYSYIVFNDKLFELSAKMNKYLKKIYMFVIKKMLNVDKQVKNCYNSNSKFITSKNLDKNINLKKFILSNFFNVNNLIEVTYKNTIIKNSIKYLDKFNYNKKVILIIDYGFDINMIELYINKFKNVDILCEYDIEFFDKINNLNIEYGTSIKFIKSKDLTEYDVCILNENIDLNEYIFNENIYFLNLTDSDNDIYSNLYYEYLKYKEYIINEENFSNNKIGNLLTKVFNDV